MPSRLLRYHEVLVDDDVRFAGACAFRRPLALDDFIAAARPAIVSASASAWQRVIARFRDNRLVPGYTDDFIRRGPISICRRLRRSVARASRKWRISRRCTFSAAAKTRRHQQA